MLIKNNKVYDVLKHFALIDLPAIATLYFGMSQIWGLPDASQVVGTITAFDTFLGVVLHVSNSQYQNSDDAYDGHVVVTDTGAATLHLDSDAVASKDELKLKVTKAAPVS